MPIIARFSCFRERIIRGGMSPLARLARVKSTFMRFVVINYSNIKIIKNPPSCPEIGNCAFSLSAATSPTSLQTRISTISHLCSASLSLRVYRFPFLRWRHFVGPIRCSPNPFFNLILRALLSNSFFAWSRIFHIHSRLRSSFIGGTFQRAWQCRASHARCISLCDLTFGCLTAGWLAV
jgi:hypothetical protein